jgi:hypothetical protein
VEGGFAVKQSNGLFGMQAPTAAVSNFSFQPQVKGGLQQQLPGQQAQFSFGNSNLFKQPEQKMMPSPFFGATQAQLQGKT